MVFWNSSCFYDVSLNESLIASREILMAESEKLKKLLMNVKEENEKVGLKFNIQKTKIMVSSLITSWHIDGEIVETVTDFFFGGGAAKSPHMVTAAMKLKDVCSLEEKLWPTSVQFSHSVVSDSLRPHESQHARPPCPPQTPRVYSNSCLSSR